MADYLKSINFERENDRSINTGDNPTENGLQENVDIFDVDHLRADSALACGVSLRCS
ncbi:hypothetical protein BN2476_460145 [Paraburkholderia piptadeniae]|uniref:Uncharacterized protein n=1 Tax=Paraburkholderia piptadeniae TaxID=1701573 RepID=A0A1N7SDB9_9BURK|nr:hypothetical protein BN2476_460145 [Paraburkholderia piptadeniae]